MNQLLDTFLAEAAELLADVDEGLLRLERDPQDAELINEVFRAAHTIKGSAGLFEFTELIRLTHAAEDLLDVVRSGGLTLDATMTDDLLAAFDLVRRFLATVTSTGHLPVDAALASAEAIARLRAPLGRSPAEGSDPGAVRGAGATGSAPRWVRALGDEWLLETATWLATTQSTLRVVRYHPATDCYFRGEDPLLLLRGVPAVERLGAEIIGTVDPHGYDEYSCAMRFVIATRASVGELLHIFQYVMDETEVAEVGAVQLRAVLAGQADAGAELDAASEDAWMVIEASLAAATVAVDGGGHLTAVARSAAAAADLLGLNADGLDAAADAGEVLAVRTALTELLSGRQTGPAAVASGPAAWSQTPTGATARVGASGSSAGAGAVGSGGDGGEQPVQEGDPSQVGIRTLKVDQEKVDYLVDLVGELIVAKNALPFLASAAEEEFGARVLARRMKDQYAVLNRIAEDLRGGVMGIRMLPFSVAFARFPRLVRDLGRRLGKQVELVTDGGDTAADKDIIESLGDPLVHLVRNCLDHGIEPLGERVAAGKPAQSTLRIVAMSDGDAVLVEVADDGRGIDPAKVRQRAYERGLIGEEEVDSMSDTDAVDLVFRPGFSTATEISDISGRGVGMDAVRTSVERLGGSATLRSVPGHGTTVRLRLPLSMAVTQVMVVSVAGQRLGVPVDSVVETVRVPRSAIGKILHADVLVLRDEVVAVLDLASVLNMGGEPSQTANVLVVQVDGEKVGLIVERFHREVDAILKPMDGVLAGTRAFSGTALLGDGLVLLVLNIKEVVACATRTG